MSYLFLKLSQLCSPFRSDCLNYISGEHKQSYLVSKLIGLHFIRYRAEENACSLEQSGLLQYFAKLMFSKRRSHIASNFTRIWTNPRLSSVYLSIIFTSALQSHLDASSSTDTCSPLRSTCISFSSFCPKLGAVLTSPIASKLSRNNLFISK